jgi:Glyoxalase-like domain
MILSRRVFLGLGGASVIAAPSFFAEGQGQVDSLLIGQVPPLLDHILLGCSELQSGIEFVERHTGVRAAMGGVHPGRGTQNALLSLGTRRYLEIIAPDPAQHTDHPLAAKLQSLTEPRLVGWAAHLRNIDALAAQLRQEGIAATGPTPGERQRPDGKTLHWQTVNLKDDLNGLLPFFIEWAADCLHPSEDAPPGCQPLCLELLTPDPTGLAKLASKLGLDAPIATGASPQLHAIIEGPKGDLSVTS